MCSIILKEQCFEKMLYEGLVKLKEVVSNSGGKWDGGGEGLTGILYTV